MVILPASGKWQVTKFHGRWWVIDPCGILCDHLFFTQGDALYTCRFWFERWGWTRWPGRGRRVESPVL